MSRDKIEVVNLSTLILLDLGSAKNLTKCLKFYQYLCICVKHLSTLSFGCMIQSQKASASTAPLLFPVQNVK